MHYKLLRMGDDGDAAKGGRDIIQQSNIVNGRPFPPYLSVK